MFGSRLRVERREAMCGGSGAGEGVKDGVRMVDGMVFCTGGEGDGWMDGGEYMYVC